MIAVILLVALVAWVACWLVPMLLFWWMAASQAEDDAAVDRDARGE